MSDYTSWYKEIQPYEPTPSSGLVVIDLQVGNCSRHGGQARIARERGDEEQLAARFARVDEILPTLVALLEAWRTRCLPVIYLVIGAAAEGYSDLHPRLRRLNEARGMRVGSSEFAVLPEIAPTERDVVLRKTTMSGFTSSAIDSTLRHMGINSVYFAGMSTDQCVLSTALDASELGYASYIVGDVCGASSPDLHDMALRLFGRFAGSVVMSGELMTHLAQVR